jgi:DNA-binding MarR family transcriptional regulator
VGTYLRYTELVTDQLTGVLERLVVGSVAITARAIAAADAELTLMQWRVLLVAGESEEGMAVGEIASRIGAHASPTSRVISRLRRRGLLESARGRLDARVVCITLTDAGRDLRSRVLKLRGRDLADVIAAASLAPGEADAVAKLALSFERFA